MIINPTFDIQLNDLRFTKYMDGNEIDAVNKQIAEQLNLLYQDTKPTCIVIMNGAFMFASDLCRKLTFLHTLKFVQLKSYEGVSSSGHVQFDMPDDVVIQGKDIIIIEDIIDTGTTMAQFLPFLHRFQPKSLRLVSLLAKPDALQHNIQIDIVGKNIPNDFVVGYGLDYNGWGRHLKDIYQYVGE